MNNANTVIELKRGKFWIEEGILFCEIRNPDDTRNLSEGTVEQYLKVISSLCKGKKMPFLIDVRNTSGVFLNTAAKKLANSIEIANLSLTEAFVVNSLKVKLLISSYKRIYEPDTPFKIFTDYQEALSYSINSKNINDGSN